MDCAKCNKEVSPYNNSRRNPDLPPDTDSWLCHDCYAKRAKEIREEQRRPKFIDSPSVAFWVKYTDKVKEINNVRK